MMLRFDKLSAQWQPIRSWIARRRAEEDRSG
jgi:hypothetical protein